MAPGPAVCQCGRTETGSHGQATGLVGRLAGGGVGMRLISSAQDSGSRKTRGSFGKVVTYRHALQVIVLAVALALSHSASLAQSSLYPNPPTGLTATALTKTQIALNWQDNANNETGFKVQRAPTTARIAGQREPTTRRTLQSRAR